MITRRQLGLAGIAGSAVALSSTAGWAQSVARPVPPRQAPAHYRFMSGGFQITALSDGHIDLTHALFPAATAELARDLARAAFLAPGPLPTSVNAFVVETEGRMILIDAGTGPSRGASVGRLPSEMRAAGINPEGVSAVLLSHLHTDHCGGLLNSGGERVFPNAEVLVAEPELRFWTDTGLPSRAPEAMQAMIRIANAVVQAYRGQLTPFVAGTMVVPGVRSIPLFGHTPGHTGFVIGTGEASLFIWGDIVHVAAYQFANPDWGLSLDVDQAASAATRVRTFAQVASDRLRVAGMHLPFPGVGHVARDGAAYRYVPRPWQPLG